MDAINIMNKYGISQLPVKKGDDIVGNISEESLLYALKNRNITGDTKIKDIMSQPLPQLGISSTIEEIQLALSTHHSAVIIKEDNKPISIITKSDLINFLLKRSERYEI
jgi:cystathionine beta-synthase